MLAIFCGFLCQEQTGALEEASAHVEGLGKSLKATWRFRHLMILSIVNPWEGRESLRKSSQDVCSKKGCDGHELFKIPESLEAFHTGKRREMSSFVAFWLHLDNH